MSMSKDRVRFSIQHSKLDKQAYRDVLCDVFGMTERELPTDTCNDRRLTIICRPSQFARFLILRDRAGIANGFKELEPELIPEEPIKTVVEVWNRPNRLYS
jgi:hypothetical protein